MDSHFSIRPPTFVINDPACFGLWTGYFFLINSTVGAGFLTIPWTYDKAGWVYSMLVQLITTLISILLAYQLIEVMAKVEVIIKMRESGKWTSNHNSLSLIFRKYQSEYIVPSSYIPELTYRRLDIVELIRILFGPRAAQVYFILLFILQQGVCVAYGSIFASSFASEVPLGVDGTCNIYDSTTFWDDCRWKYWVFLTIFSVSMIYFTIKGYQEQIWMQSVMSIMRFVVISLVLATSLYHISSHSSYDSSDYNPIDMPPIFDYKYLGFSLPVIMIASMFHLNVSNICEFLQERENRLSKILVMTACTAGVVYLLLGLIVSFAVEDVESLSILAYRDYTGGYDNRHWWSYMIEYIIMIFPALDVFSSYPLQSILLSNSLITMHYGTIPVDFLPRGRILFYKLLGCVPSLLLAYIFYDLV
jgi:amino acid permease